MSKNRTVAKIRQPYTDRLEALKRDYNGLRIANRPVSELRSLLRAAGVAVRQINSRVDYVNQQAAAAMAITAVEREIMRVNNGGSAMLIDELIAKTVHHPHVDANKRLLHELEVYSIRLGEQFGENKWAMSEQAMRRHYEERVGTCERTDEVLGLDLRLGITMPVFEPELARLRVRLRDRSSRMLVPVTYCYRTVAGTTTAVGVVHVSLETYYVQSRLLGGIGFDDLGKKVPLLLEVVCSDRTTVTGIDDSDLLAKVESYQSKAAKSNVAKDKHALAGRR